MAAKADCPSAASLHDHDGAQSRNLHLGFRPPSSLSGHHVHSHSSSLLQYSTRLACARHALRISRAYDGSTAV